MKLTDVDIFQHNLITRLAAVERRVRELEDFAVAIGVADSRYGRLIGTATATWNPASMADDGEDSTTVTVAGAGVEHLVIATHDQIGAEDVAISAHVQADNTVRVVLINKSGGVLDIAEGNVIVAVFKTG